MSSPKFQLLTVQEVADIMRVSTMTVYRMIKAGDIRAVRVGDRTYRIEEADLEHYLESRYTHNDDPPAT